MRWSPSVVIEAPAVLGRLDDGRVATRWADGSTRCFSIDEFARYYEAREKLVKSMVDDPYRHGYCLPIWEKADAAYADLRKEVSDGVIELLLLGGNRSGKSRYFARRAMQHLVEKPGARVWCLQSTESSSVQNQQPYLWEYLPKEFKADGGKLKRGVVTNITYSQKGGFTENTFVLPNGSQCWFKFYAQNVATVEGAELDFCWADELVTNEWLEAVRFRLVTRAGELGVGFTPVDGYTPTVRSFLDGATTIDSSPAELLDGELVPRLQDCVRSQSKVVYFHTEDNPFGNYPALARELRGSSRERILMRAYGVPTKVSMAKFPKFSDAVHVCSPDIIPFDGTNYQVVDPCDGRNWAMIWARFSSDGRCWVFREWPGWGEYIPGVGEVGPWAESSGDLLDGKKGDGQKSFGFGFEDYASEIARVEDGIEVVERIMDARYGNKPTLTADGVHTLIDQCADRVGLFFRAAPTKGISEGVDIINDWLAYDSGKPVDSINCPRLFISSQCRNLIYSMKHWTGIDGQKGATKDWIDLLRYLLLSGVGYNEGDYLKVRSSFGGY